MNNGERVGFEVILLSLSRTEQFRFANGAPKAQPDSADLKRFDQKISWDMRCGRRP